MPRLRARYRGDVRRLWIRWIPVCTGMTSKTVSVAGTDYGTTPSGSRSRFFSSSARNGGAITEVSKLMAMMTA